VTYLAGHRRALALTGDGPVERLEAAATAFRKVRFQGCRAPVARRETSKKRRRASRQQREST